VSVIVVALTVVEMVVGAITHAASRTADAANMVSAAKMRSGVAADPTAPAHLVATHVAAAAHVAATAAEATTPPAATLDEGQAARGLKRIGEVGGRGNGRG
jgi:hypothetical protein